jgi:1-deoxy-D-xylulose-5-phosphate reductoisomerase
VAEAGGTAPAVLNAANEVAVAAFLGGRLGFLGIPRVIEDVLGRHRNVSADDLSTVLEADRWARELAEAMLAGSAVAET